MPSTHDIGSRTSYLYRFGTAEFDESRYELRIAGLLVEAEWRALELLAYLLRHAGEVATKEELLREVWFGRITVDKVLPNTIGKLRRALGDGNAQFIVTQGRLGYRLDGPVERTVVGRVLSSRLNFTPNQIVPLRPSFALKHQLDASRSSEVWLAEHKKTREKRVYKFGVDEAHLRSLKREVTLSRVLADSLGTATNFVPVIDWNFEEEPYFIECEYAGESLEEWSKTHLAALNLTSRLRLFLQAADAIAAAHSVGVLHKDLKPSNLLVAPDETGWLLRVTDFGSGRLLELDRLEELGITGIGLTSTQSLLGDSAAGTPLYIAPEVVAGQAPTVQSDLYALGIVLYQLLSGDLKRPLAPGWEHDVEDELLCEDIRAATDGSPARRLASVAEFAQRLRQLESRREQAARLRETQTQVQRSQEALARSRARRPYMYALVVVLLVGVIATLGLYRAATKARDVAQRELERANSLNQFFGEEVIGYINPFVSSKGKEATLKEALLAARDRIGKRVALQPLAEAAIRGSLVAPLNMLDMLPQATSEARLALRLYEHENLEASRDGLRARALLVRMLSRMSRYDEAQTELNKLEELTAGATDAWSRFFVSSPKATFYSNQDDPAKAIPEYEIAIAAIAEADPANYFVRDSMRADLISSLAAIGKPVIATQEGERLISEIAARGGDNEVAVAYARYVTAQAFVAGGDLARARSLLIEARQTATQKLGSDHWICLYIDGDLFAVEAQDGKWQEALTYARSAHSGLLGKFGENHAMTNISRMRLGRALYMTGNAPEAEVQLRVAHEKLSAGQAQLNPRGQLSGFYLAEVEIDREKLDEASALLEKIDEKNLEIAEHSNGAWAPRLMALRGLLFFKRGDLLAATPLLSGAIEAMKKKSPCTEPLCIKVKEALIARQKGK